MDESWNSLINYHMSISSAYLSVLKSTYSNFKGTVISIQSMSLRYIMKIPCMYYILQTAMPRSAEKSNSSLKSWKFEMHVFLTR